MNGTHRVHPPIGVWRVAMLLLATVTLYQFVWLYRLAQDLKAKRDESITPWHFVAAPLLGPLLAIPVHYLASQLKQWQIEEDSEIGHLAEPVLVAMMVIIAYLPLMLLVVATTDVLTVVLVIALMLCLPYLAMQGQLNINKGQAGSSPKYGAFTKYQLGAMCAGMFLAVPIYTYTFTGWWDLYDASELQVGDVIAPEHGYYRLRITDSGWRRINPGNLGEHTDLELLGPDDRTWAMVYVYSNSDVDTIMTSREHFLRRQYRDANCTRHKSLLPERSVMLGSVECTGQHTPAGTYLIFARVLQNEDRSVEIVTHTFQYETGRFEGLTNRLRRLASELEIAPP